MPDTHLPFGSSVSRPVTCYSADFLGKQTKRDLLLSRLISRPIPSHYYVKTMGASLYYAITEVN